MHLDAIFTHIAEGLVYNKIVNGDLRIWARDQGERAQVLGEGWNSDIWISDSP
jgi:arginine deiminase